MVAAHACMHQLNVTLCLMDQYQLLAGQAILLRAYSEDGVVFSGFGYSAVRTRLR